MRRRPKSRETTRIIWDCVYEEYKCEKCEKLIFYNFGFSVCPYCARQITQTQERRTRTSRGDAKGILVR